MVTFKLKLKSTFNCHSELECSNSVNEKFTTFSKQPLSFSIDLDVNFENFKGGGKQIFFEFRSI